MNVGMLRFFYIFGFIVGMIVGVALAIYLLTRKEWKWTTVLSAGVIAAFLSGMGNLLMNWLIGRLM